MIRRAIATAALGAALAALVVPATSSPAQVTGCEHSSNFHAPPGCPDDGSGRPSAQPEAAPTATAAPALGPAPEAAPAVATAPRFTG